VKWIVAAAGLLLAAAPLVLASEFVRYADGPPPGFTGDFGEPTCGTCHMDADVVPDAREVVVHGVPAHYEAGKTYRLVVSATSEGIAAAGFQLASRTARDRQAGTLRAIDGRARVMTDSATGVEFASHTAEGTALVGGDSARWALEWTAPLTPADSVVFSAVVNAANGDDSNFGDRILTRRYVTIRRATP
jgi:hypothetical protein